MTISLDGKTQGAPSAQDVGDLVLVELHRDGDFGGPMELEAITDLRLVQDDPPPSAP